MIKVALALTVKGSDDEAPLLERCLESVKDHVDGIFIQLNAPKGRRVTHKIKHIAQKYTDNIAIERWEGNFAKSKNLNFAQVPKDYDWILWLDSDDTVENPEKIKEVLAIVPKSVAGLYIRYDYAHDEWGNPTVVHWNCRLVRNNGSYRWKSSFDDTNYSVHETLIATRTVGQLANNEFRVVHHADFERQDRSLIRNITLLEKMHEDMLAKDHVDARILFYLGSHYCDALEYKKAVTALTDYLKISGWAEERAQAHVLIGKILVSWQDDTKARTAFLMAQGEDPNNIDSYLELGKLEFKNKRYNTAAVWLERGNSIQQEPTTLVRFNNDYDLKMTLAKVYANIGGKSLPKALKMAQEALKLRPLSPQAKEDYEEIETLVEFAKNTKAIARVVRLLRKEPVRTLAFADLMPDDFQDSPVLVAARLKNQPEGKKWPRKSIAIVCGQGPLEIWGPWSLKDGIGGSEEAVIQLSTELSNLGWRVTVFATPGAHAGWYAPNGRFMEPKDDAKWLDYINQGGHIKGCVEWKQYWQLNPKDEHDVMIAWRNPGFFLGDWEARKKYVWMHDVMDKEEFAPEVLKTLDKVILLSKYHRSLFPNIPDKKVFLSANGIVPEDFVKEDGKHQRDPHRIIWMSSHIRGLELLYSVWLDVKKAVPDAKLDIYYGWESFINILKNNPDRMAWRAKMMAWEKELPDVTDHGKISHKQIVKEIQKSGIWAYPCPFPEIYCITAIKSQAGGAVPVSSNFAALDETVQFGTKVPMIAQDEDTPVGKWAKSEVEQYKTALIDMLKDTKKQEAIRPKMQKWARTQSWKAVAEQWDSELA